MWSCCVAMARGWIRPQPQLVGRCATLLGQKRHQQQQHKHASKRNYNSCSPNSASPTHTTLPCTGCSAGAGAVLPPAAVAASARTRSCVLRDSAGAAAIMRSLKEAGQPARWPFGVWASPRVCIVANKPQQACTVTHREGMGYEVALDSLSGCANLFLFRTMWLEAHVSASHDRCCCRSFAHKNQASSPVQMQALL